MEIIALCLVITILSFVLCIGISKLLDSIGKDSNNYYFNKMQDIDNKILEKQMNLEKINVPAKENKKEEIKVKEINNIDSKFLSSFSSSDYEGDNALEIARNIDEIFIVDEEKIIKKFINKIKDTDDFDLLMKIKDYFSPNLIYKLKSLNKENQIKEIKKMLTDKEYEVFSSYLKNHKFKIEKFLMDLDLLIEKYNPNIEVITGNKNKNFDKLSSYIKTVYDKSVYKGIIIKFQGNIYDYSINERDVN